MRTLARDLPASGARPLPVRAVSEAVRLEDAAAAVVHDLAADGLMPSVYVEVDGRLRCRAARGYWQIFDGMPPSAGVIGHTYAGGRETVVPDVSASPHYLDAAGAVRAEVCVPLRAAGRVVGVLNVESHRTMEPREVERVRGCARLLSHFLATHPPEPVTAAERLARRAARIAHLSTPDAIAAEAVHAACDVARLDSALLVLADPHGELHACQATGPLGDVLVGLEPDELAELAAWVEHGTSSYTTGLPAPERFTGHATLRAAGAETLVVLPLEAPGRRIGFLALADARARVLPTQEVEVLELLAAQVAAALRVAAAVGELRDRASRDALTGLGHHAAFHEALEEALGPGRRPALAVVDLDGFKGLNDTHGHRAGDATLRALAALLERNLPPEGRAFRIGGDEFALLVPAGGASAAAAAAEAVRGGARAALGLSVSVGVAEAAPGETAGDLVDRADAALYEVKRDGRDGVRVAPAAEPAPRWQARLF